MYPVMLIQGTTNVVENYNDSDDQEDDNISCLENKIINKDNSSNVDSVFEPVNDKTFHILRQERNDLLLSISYFGMRK